MIAARPSNKIESKQRNWRHEAHPGYQREHVDGARGLQQNIADRPTEGGGKGQSQAPAGRIASDGAPIVASPARPVSVPAACRKDGAFLLTTAASRRVKCLALYRDRSQPRGHAVCHPGEQEAKFADEQRQTEKNHAIRRHSRFGHENNSCSGERKPESGQEQRRKGAQPKSHDCEACPQIAATRTAERRCNGRMAAPITSRSRTVRRAEP
jgi:hypothetical protein